MTNSEIKSSIQDQLGQLTLDDVYTDPRLNYLKQSFVKLANIPSVDQIGNYLFAEFLKTCSGNLCFNLQKAYTELNNKLYLLSPDLIKLQKQVKKQEGDLNYYQKHLEEFPTQKEKLESELEEINKEIEKIIPPADDSPDVQLLELNKLKSSKTAQIQMLPNSIDFYQREIEKFHVKLKTLYEKISDIESEKKNIEDQIAANRLKLQEIKDTSPSRFENEYKALVFLYRVLQQQILARKKTGTYEEKQNKYDDLKKQWGIEIVFSADSYEAEITDIAKEKIITGLTDLVRSQNIIPENWREKVYTLLGQTIPDISGKIAAPEENSNSCFVKRTIHLSKADTSALLALKIACQSNQSLNIAGNKIILALHGGVTATMLFREKGAMINSFQKYPFEIYFNCLQKQEKYHLNDLYETTETNTFKGKTLIPEAYYILTENYVLEIYFDKWPGTLEEKKTGF